MIERVRVFNRFEFWLGFIINMWGREWEKNHIFSENNLTKKET
jgi:hypothetical protein